MNGLTKEQNDIFKKIGPLVEWGTKHPTQNSIKVIPASERQFKYFSKIVKELMKSPESDTVEVSESGISVYGDKETEKNYLCVEISGVFSRMYTHRKAFVKISWGSEVLLKVGN